MTTPVPRRRPRRRPRLRLRQAPAPAPAAPAPAPPRGDAPRTAAAPRRRPPRPPAAARCRTRRGPGTVETHHFHSDALGVDKDYVLYLPGGYAAQPDARWPVIYLLHGLGGDETNWTAEGGVAAAADKLGLAAIIVMPDGDDGFYANWVDRPRLRRVHARRHRPVRSARGPRQDLRPPRRL